MLKPGWTPLPVPADPRDDRRHRAAPREGATPWASPWPAAGSPRATASGPGRAVLRRPAVVRRPAGGRVRRRQLARRSCSDANWQATAAGPLTAAGIYAGESFDARLIAAAGPHRRSPATGHAQRPTPSGPDPGPRTSPAVRVTEEVDVRRGDQVPAGATLLDFGQNLVGRLRIRVAGPAGTTITLRHAEVLEHGELGVRPLRVADATDHYTLAGAASRNGSPTSPSTASATPRSTAGRASSTRRRRRRRDRHSDMDRTGWFDCSTRWSTSCTRTWSGACGATSSTCPPTARSATSGSAGPATSRCSPRPRATCTTPTASSRRGWSTSPLEQQHAGGVPFVVPDVLDSGQGPGGGLGRRRDDRAVGALRALRRPACWPPSTRQHAGLGRAAARARRRASPVGGRLPVRRLARPGRAAGPARQGEDRRRPRRQRATCSGPPTSSARTAALLGHRDDADRYAERAEQVRPAWLREYVTPAGRIVSDAQTATRSRIMFDIATDDRVAADGRPARLAGPPRRLPHRHRLRRHPAGRRRAHPHRAPDVAGRLLTRPSTRPGSTR